MGSSGSGNFSDYPQGSSSPSGGGSGSGQKGEVDRCSKVFTAELEDVAMSEFYIGTKQLPGVGTTVSIGQRKRLVALAENGVSIGSLPTTFNYLASCLKSGWKYVGTIRTSKDTVLGPLIAVDFTPISE